MAKILQKCVSVAFAIVQVWRTYFLEKLWRKSCATELETGAVGCKETSKNIEKDYTL